VLRLPLTLEPGLNTVRLETEAPSSLDAGAFTGVSFSDLHVAALEPGAAIDLVRSSDLLKRSERYGLVTLNTVAPRSSLALTNHGSKACRAELAFKYQLKISDEAKRRGYEREVRYLDAQLGRLLDHLRRAGIYDRSAFLVMGDHGEGLGENDSHFGHIHYLNKVYTHVPFILSGRGVRARGARRELASNLSVAPTLLSLVGAKKAQHMQGSDALGAAAEPKLFLETYSPEAYFDAFSVVHFPWQVVFHPGRTERNLEFFNLEKDRFGTIDLQAGADPSGKRSEMVNSVLRISRIITANKRKQESLNQKTMDTLKSLGYL
jgi:arylsulfatase A-like enzyme